MESQDAREGSPPADAGAPPAPIQAEIPAPSINPVPAPAPVPAPTVAVVSPTRRRRPWALVLVSLVMLIAWGALTWWVVPRLTALEVSVATLHAISSDDRDYMNTAISESTRSQMPRSDFDVALVTARHLLAVSGWSSLDVSAPKFTIIDGSEFGVDAVSALGRVRIPVSVAVTGDSATCVAELRGTGNAVTTPIEIQLDRKFLGWSVRAIHIDRVAVIGQ